MWKTSNFPSRIGIGGGGQLGTMMILESRGLPLSFNIYVESRDEPAVQIATDVYDRDDFHSFVDSSDYVTFEFEHVRREMLEYAQKNGKLRPGFRSVELKMERHLEKEFLRDNSFPVGEFIIARNGEEALEKSRHYEKFVIKRSTGGYDGKGQYYYNNMNDFPQNEDGYFVIEKYVDYESEASIICGRDSQGREIFYEPSYNENKNGILIRNATGIKEVETIERMKEIASSLMKKLDYIGIMGIEFFITEDGPLINEYAPRVHNTGHHTLMGTSVSQFENHVRAVMGIPMEDPVTYVPSGIVNVIGTDLSGEKMSKILGIGGTRIFMYRKKEIRRKRKMGHVCVTARDAEELNKKEKIVEEILYPEGVENYI